MPARKYKTDPAQLLTEGQQIVHTTSDAKYRHKVEMVNLVLRACLGSLRTRFFGGIFRRWALLNLEIHKRFLRFRALTGEKSVRKSAHAEILNRL